MPFHSLKILGFKSFVDETILPLESGLTGIVGPNGCGKSNIVEAIRWAMGESNARKIRGTEMDDVIFLGTPRRAPRQFAEVEITIKNPDHDLLSSLITSQANPEEIVINRRIERGLGSFYKLNGKELRQKDVQYLFMDQGSGFGSSALVAQGRISAIIAMKPEERRSILEEAAGIRSLSGRKHEAELKLHATLKNLGEVDKIIVIYQDQAKNLKKQANDALKYQQLSDEIRQYQLQIIQIQAWQNYHEMQKLISIINEYTEKNIILTRESSQIQAVILQESAKLLQIRQEHDDYLNQETQCKSQMQAIDFKKSQIISEVQNLQKTLEQLHNDNEIAQKSSIAINQAITQYTADISNFQNQIPPLKIQLTQLNQEFQEITAQIPQITAQIQAKKQEIAQNNHQYHQIQTKITQSEQEIAMKQTRQTQLNQEYENAPNMQNYTDKIAQLTTEIQAYHLEECQKKIDNYTQQSPILKSQFQEYQAKFQAQLRNYQQKRQENHQKCTILNTEIQTLQAIIKRDHRENLINLLHVAPNYENLLALCLGDEINATINSDHQQYWQARQGENLQDTTLDDLPRLKDFVDAPAELNIILKSCFIAPDFATALSLLPKLTMGMKIISIDGGIVRFDGYCQKPGAITAAAQILSHRNRIKIANAELTSQQGALNEIDSELSEFSRQGQKDSNEKQALIDACDQQINTARQELLKMHQIITQKQQEIHKLEQIIGQDKIIKERIMQEIAQIHQEIPQIMAHYPQYQAQFTHLGEIQAKLNQEYQEYDAKFIDYGNKKHASEIAMQACQNNWQNLQQSLNNAKQMLENAQKQAQANELQIANYTARIAQTCQKIQENQDLPNIYSAEYEKIANSYQEISENRKNCGSQVVDGEIALKSAEAQASQVQKNAQNIHDELLKTQFQYEHIFEKFGQLEQQLWQEYQWNFQESQQEIANLAQIPTGQLHESLKKCEIQRLNLGAVNLLAAQEFDDITAKIAEISAEKQDLLNATQKLHQAITKINREARLKLAQAFELVNKNFKNYFQTLFGGGEAELIFTQDQDILKSGLDFAVRPPGKKSGPLSLMSGGEQTLTALALILAVMDYNPPPICILDEVDAPLDDANVHRFTQLLRKRVIEAPHTRFLIITHHRLTMARMDRLFGITMAEPGVSRLVGVNLERAEKLAEPRKNTG